MAYVIRRHHRTDHSLRWSPHSHRSFTDDGAVNANYGAQRQLCWSAASRSVENCTLQMRHSACTLRDDAEARHLGVAPCVCRRRARRALGELAWIACNAMRRCGHADGLLHTRVREDA
jgi:hypothetical protein